MGVGVLVGRFDLATSIKVRVGQRREPDGDFLRGLGNSLGAGLSPGLEFFFGSDEWLVLDEGDSCQQIDQVGFDFAGRDHAGQFDFGLFKRR